MKQSRLRICPQVDETKLHQTKQFRISTKLLGKLPVTRTVWKNDLLLWYPVNLVLNGLPANFIVVYTLFLDFKKEWQKLD